MSELARPFELLVAVSVLGTGGIALSTQVLGFRTRPEAELALNQIVGVDSRGWGPYYQVTRLYSPNSPPEENSK